MSTNLITPYMSRSALHEQMRKSGVVAPFAAVQILDPKEAKSVSILSALIHGEAASSLAHHFMTNADKGEAPALYEEWAHSHTQRSQDAGGVFSSLFGGGGTGVGGSSGSGGGGGGGGGGKQVDEVRDLIVEHATPSSGQHSPSHSSPPNQESRDQDRIHGPTFTYRYTLAHSLPYLKVSTPRCEEENLHFDKKACAINDLSPCRYSDKVTFWMEKPAVDRRNEVKLPTGAQFVLGDPGHSCQTACAQIGLKCDIANVQALNNCMALREHFDCTGSCVAGSSIFDAKWPAIVIPRQERQRGSKTKGNANQSATATATVPQVPPPPALSSKCVHGFPRDHATCGGAHPRMRRACACSGALAKGAVRGIAFAKQEEADAQAAEAAAKSKSAGGGAGKAVVPPGTGASEGVDKALWKVPPDTEVKVVRGGLGESCTEACSNLEEGFACDQDNLPALNNCDALRNNFGCKECSPNEGNDQPAFVPSAPVGQMPEGRCLVKRSKSFLCRGQHRDTQRLCACVRDV